ncbi:dehydrogenase [Paenibacillus sp.]|uniref:dehydrogenase n=1 Tax=Paenibacillus sp. TaxID=58172 RepID=UPI002D29F78B|nr:dehydrogenase [Paenibacillus sp.]HZG58211.1 dehydrogenase [Paenibacillus sp.]
MKQQNQKHTAQLPSPRGIRRACSRELYRTLKRLNAYVPEEKVQEAEKLYFEKVVGNLLWIFEHRSNKKKQAEWWAVAVAPDIAELWGVNEEQLVRAFKEGFAGA